MHIGHINGMLVKSLLCK